MPGLAVTELLQMLDAAFEGDDEHSLLANLPNVREVDWQSAPGRAAERSLASSTTLGRASTCTKTTHSATPRTAEIAPR